MERPSFLGAGVIALIAAFACSPDRVVQPPDSTSSSSITASHQPAGTYEMIDLGVLGNASPGMLDRHGRVFAYAFGPDFHMHIYRWDNGTVTDLGALPGNGSIAFSPSGVAAGTACDHSTDTCTFYLFDQGTVTPLDAGGTAYADESRVRAVLDDGTVIGVIQYAGYHDVGVFWKNGVRHELPPLDDANPAAFPRAMNKHEQLIGQSINDRRQSRPYFWEHGVARDLGGLFDQPCADDPTVTCGNADVSAINDHGDMVGYSGDGTGRERAVIWRNGGPAQDLGVLPGEFTMAQGFNDRGDIYGFGGPDHWWGQINGVLYGPGNPTGAFSHPTNMNGRGEVVGFLRGVDGKGHSFVWSMGHMTDLGIGPEGSQLSQATHINDQGEVLGTYDNQGQRLVLWRPANGNTAASAGP